MKLRAFGRTSTLIPVIGQGTTGTGAMSSRDASKDLHRIRVLQQGIDLGMTLIDTAELYGGGHGEEVAGRAIAGQRERVFLASKFNPSNNAPAAMEQALAGSLQRLGTDFLDLYQMHWPNPAVPIEETLAGMMRMVEKGKVRHIGLSNVSLPELQQACKIAPISSVQLEFNLTDRSIEYEILPFCKQQGITVLAYGPLDHTRSYSENETVRKIAKKYNKTSPQILMNWVISRNSITALTMTTNLVHLAESAEAATFELDAIDVIALEDATKCEVMLVSPRAIQISPSSRPTYFNLEQAKINQYDLIPHPLDLANNIQRYAINKPVRVKRLLKHSSSATFELVGDHLRYWAWIIAYGWECPIPAYDVTPSLVS
jgi:diketogulonate reductase-like aldo/keto reductase